MPTACTAPTIRLALLPEDAAARHDERNVMIHKGCLLRIPGGAQENVVLAFGDLTLVSMNRLHS